MTFFDLNWIEWVFAFIFSATHFNPFLTPAFVIGPPAIQARQVLAEAHLKSKASQYPSSPASIVSQDSVPVPPIARPALIHSSISGVRMKAAQLPHLCFFASSAETPHSEPSRVQYSSLGSPGFRGPYIADSMALARFSRLARTS